jgi:thiol-disulfide isomerase/thioredoxin
MKYAMMMTCALALAAGCANDTDPGSGAGGLVELCDGAVTLDPAEYGSLRDSIFAPMTIETCNGGSFDFYGSNEFYADEIAAMAGDQLPAGATASQADFCTASATVVVMAAGWCGPCRAEAEEIEEELNQAYADLNVRVVQLVIEDNSFDTPDAAFCRGWQDQYDLTNPVLLDLGRRAEEYFPLSALPGFLIVDSQGRIRYREAGFEPGLGNITRPLDEIIGN